MGRNTKVDIEHLRQIPYLDVDVLAGRVVNVMPLWEDGRWRMWLPAPNGFQEVLPKDTQEVAYVGKAAANDSDLFIPFVETLWQRMSWSDLLGKIVSLLEDVHNMSTSVSKIDFYFKYRTEAGHGVNKYVETEVEYLLTLARSIFDLIHSIIATTWNNKIKLLDGNDQNRKQQVTGKLRKILIEEDRFRTSQEISDKFVFPASLANAYAAIGPAFMRLRSIRDRIIHHGQALGRVFVTDKGFGVDPREQPYSDFKDVPQARFNENIVSLRPYLASIVFDTIASCNLLIDGLSREIKLPDEIAPGHRVYFRSYYTSALLDLKLVLEREQQWWVN